MALAADPVPELGTLALRLLRREEGKAPQQLDKCISEGVPLAYRLYTAAAQAFAAHGQHQGVDHLHLCCLSIYFRMQTCTNATSLPRRCMSSTRLYIGLQAEVLQGLCGVYSNVVQPSASSRHAFLAALLRPLDRAADLHSRDAVLAADLHQLRFVVQLLFALPLKRGDEGMRVLEPAHAMLYTRGEATLDALRAALTEAGQQAEKDAAEKVAVEKNVPGPVLKVCIDTCCKSLQCTVHHVSSRCVSLNAAQAAVRASLVLTMLLMLKASLCRAYGLTAERVAAYAAGGDACKQEERSLLSKAADVGLPVDKLDMEADCSVEAALAQYKVGAVFAWVYAFVYGYIHAAQVFKHLMAAEAADVLAPSPSSKPAARRASTGTGAACVQRFAFTIPSTGGDEATPTAARGRGGRGRGRGQGSGRGQCSGRGRGRGRKRARVDDSTSEEESEAWASP